VSFIPGLEAQTSRPGMSIPSKAAFSRIAEPFKFAIKHSNQSVFLALRIGFFRLTWVLPSVRKAQRQALGWSVSFRSCRLQSVSEAAILPGRVEFAVPLTGLFVTPHPTPGGGN